MIDESIAQTIRACFESGRKLVYEFTGAGSLALAWLHSVGGSSRMLLEACDRYCSDSLRELLGHVPEKFVSSDTAAAMARRAYHRAVRLSDGVSPCVGLACTATIATDRAKRGDHACHVAVMDAAGLTDYSILLTKGARDRLGEETVVARLILHALSPACDVDPPTVDLIAGEQIVRTQTGYPDPVHLLLNGALSTVTAHPDGRFLSNEPFTGVLLSGSFNPLHCGHETMLRVAGNFLGLPTAYELPVVNADKPALRPDEIERRVGQFRRAPVILTREPLFRQKAELFPRCTFLMGYDTAVRFVDARYYGSEASRNEALASIQSRGCRVLVAARPMGALGIRTLGDVPIPAGFGEMFVELPRSEFLLDLSSTELRGNVPHL